jgi:ribosomal protein L30E
MTAKIQKKQQKIWHFSVISVIKCIYYNNYIDLGGVAKAFFTVTVTVCSVITEEMVATLATEGGASNAF